MPRIIMNRAFIARWTRMPHSTGRLSASASSHHSLSSAAFITNIAESDFRHAQGVLGGRGSLLAPPNHVPGIKNELGPFALDVLHDFAGDPLAALQPEHRAPHAREQLYILD